MKHVYLFAGTTEGRKIAEFLVEADIESTVFVTTEYGRSLLPVSDRMHVKVGKMTEKQIREMLLKNRNICVIDATHPYAMEITKTLDTLCREFNTDYYRIIREEGKSDYGIWFSDYDEIIKWLSERKGKIFVTTGSKNLDRFTRLPDYQDRCVVRVLNDMGSIARSFGFRDELIIEGKGPFSTEDNLNVLKKYDIRYMVTKDSGPSGGFTDKIGACRIANVQPLIISRPACEKGYTLVELEELFGK